METAFLSLFLANSATAASYILSRLYFLIKKYNNINCCEDFYPGEKIPQEKDKRGVFGYRHGKLSVRHGALCRWQLCNYPVGPLSMNQYNTQMKTQIYWKLDNCSGWCKNYLIAKYLSNTVYACAYCNNRKPQFL